MTRADKIAWAKDCGGGLLLIAVTIIIFMALDVAASFMPGQQ